MREEESLARAAVVAEATEWIGTPYHHAGRIKGRDGGTDCAMLLLEVYERVGLLPHYDPPHYPPDWALHRDEERYLLGAFDRATEIEGPPRAGDVLLVKFGRCFSHGAIVVEWPRCIHATLRQRVGYVDAEIEASFRNAGKLRPFKFFTLWPGA